MGRRPVRLSLEVRASPGSPLLTLLDGFEALAARLLQVPPDDFAQVLKKEKDVFERAREQRRSDVDRAGEEPDGR